MRSISLSNGFPQYATKRAKEYQKAAPGLHFYYTSDSKEASEYFINKVMKAAYRKLNLTFDERLVRRQMAHVNDMRYLTGQTEAKMMAINGWTHYDLRNFTHAFLNRLSDPKIMAFFTEQFRANIFQINQGRFGGVADRLIIVPLYNEETHQLEKFLFVRGSLNLDFEVSFAHQLTLAEIKSIAAEKGMIGISLPSTKIRAVGSKQRAESSKQWRSAAATAIRLRSNQAIRQSGNQAIRQSGKNSEAEIRSQ